MYSTLTILEGVVRILLENILRRYIIKVRKFLGFLEKVKW